jgi:hypothetical protein
MVVTTIIYDKTSLKTLKLALLYYYIRMCTTVLKKQKKETIKYETPVVR